MSVATKATASKAKSSCRKAITFYRTPSADSWFYLLSLSATSVSGLLTPFAHSLPSLIYSQNNWFGSYSGPQRRKWIISEAWSTSAAIRTPWALDPGPWTEKDVTIQILDPDLFWWFVEFSRLLPLKKALFEVTDLAGNEFLLLK